jgi:hypothetical protein
MAEKILLARDYLPYNLMVAAERDNPNHKSVYKYGFNATVGTAGTDTIWLQEGAYTWQTSAQTVSVTSANAADDADTGGGTPGTGALTVVIEGLDANYAEQSETITMNGTTVVNSANTYIRLHRMYVATAGTGLTNTGVIYAASSGDTYTTPGVPDTATKIMSTIGAGEGQTLQAFYTVPAGYTAYMTSLTAGSVDGSNATTIDLRSRAVGGAFRTKSKFVVFKTSFTVPFDVPLAFPEKTDIEVRGASALSTTDVAANFSLLLMAN